MEAALRLLTYINYIHRVYSSLLSFKDKSSTLYPLTVTSKEGNFVS